ncbi:hypothetical protein DRJ17_07610 [Candidatus Woesearchaeota archaeon]|nr:MAG: hypothetical protein DRJ17_07610 [Candidatus Woesearchaeota archaeon]
MVSLRPLEKIIEKWKNRAVAAQGDYQFGIQNPLKDWATNAAAAQDAWAAGVQDAISRGAFGKGVKKVGTEKWQRKAMQLGAPRYAQGVQASDVDYRAGFEPYYEALSRLTLPPRGPRGDPRNLERVRIIMETLRKIKTSQGGG